MLRSSLRFALALGATLGWPVLAQTPPAATPAAAPVATPANPATPTAPSAVVGDHNVQLGDRIPPEQQLQLQAGDDRFAARYIADLSPEHRGAVIVLPDSGQHQSWPFTVAALLDDLPLHGWSTLAIELPAPALSAPPTTNPPSAQPPSPPPQTPAAPASAFMSGSETGVEKQVQARIEAAVAKLIELHPGKPQQIVLIGFGSGSWRAAEFARRQAESSGKKLPEPIRALVLVDPRNHLPAALADLPKLLPTTELPLQDIVQNSETATRADAEARRRAVLHQKERIYQPLALPPINANDANDQTALIKRIRSWMQRNVQPEEKKKPLSR